MQNIRTLYDDTLQNCHSERSEESNAETLRGVYPERSRRSQGDNPSVSILWSLIYIRVHLIAMSVIVGQIVIYLCQVLIPNPCLNLLRAWPQSDAQAD